MEEEFDVSNVGAHDFGDFRRGVIYQTIAADHEAQDVGIIRQLVDEAEGWQDGGEGVERRCVEV